MEVDGQKYKFTRCNLMFGFLKQLFGPEADFQDLIQNKKAHIVDVRSPGEFASGHIKGSVNIPLQSITGKASALAKKQPVIVCCASGMRSGQAKRILKSQGIEEVYNAGSWSSLKNHTK